MCCQPTVQVSWYWSWLANVLFPFVCQVSAVSDQIGMEDMGVHPGELDDDEGGGLVSSLLFNLCFLFCYLPVTYNCRSYALEIFYTNMFCSL